MDEKDSVALYFAQIMLHALGAQPQRLRAVLAQAGIDAALLGQPQARVPASAFAALWLIQIDELQDEFFRLDRHGMPPGAFALICRALIQEPNLGKALGQCLGNFGLFLHDFRGQLSVRGPRAVLRVHSDSADPAARGYGDETFLVLMISLLCWLGGRRISIDRAAFAHQRVSLRDDPLLWGTHLSFGAPCTEIEFSSHYLALPVVQDLASLKVFLRSAPQWLVVRFRNQQSLVARVQQRLRGTAYGQWPTLPALAAEQQMSPSTFRRTLAREHGSFQQIKDEVRRSLAFELLRQGTLSVSEIAEQTGFQEPSAFHRAFRKWTGQTPGRYRAGA